MGFTNGFNRDGLNHERLFAHDKAVTLFVLLFELGLDGIDITEINDQRGVGTVITQMQTFQQAGLVIPDALLLEFSQSIDRQSIKLLIEISQAFSGELAFNSLFTHGTDIGQAHAIGRQNAGERMNKDLGHTKGIGNLTGMLTTSTAKALQDIVADVIAALHGNLFDGVCHVFNSNTQETFGDFFGCADLTGVFFDIGRHVFEALADGFGIQRFVTFGAKNIREEVRLDLAQHDVDISHRQRTATTIGRRPRICTGTVRANAETCTIKVQDRPATSRNRVDFHHRCTHAHTGNLGFEVAFVFAVIVRNIGRCAAHIKTDDLFVAIHFCGTDHADNPASRPRQDRVLALELDGIGQTTVGLHEHQFHAAQFAGNLFDITTQDRRQIGIDHGGIPARDQLHQRADLMADGHLGKADVARNLFSCQFMCGIAITMHEHDGTGANAAVIDFLQVRPQGIKVHPFELFALRVKTTGGLDHGFIKRFRQDDVAIKQTRAVLIGQTQRIAEALVGDQNSAVALTFEKGVGCNRCAHFDSFDFLGWNFLFCRDFKQFADALNGGVFVTLGVFRQQLVGDKRAIGLAGNDIGKSAAAIDPELPFGLSSHLRVGRFLVERCHDAHSFRHLYSEISSILVSSNNELLATHLRWQPCDDPRENGDQKRGKQQQEEEWQSRNCNLEQVLACQSLQNKKVKADRWRDLRHFDHQHHIDAKPQKIDTGRLHHWQDHRGGQNHHRNPVKETTKDDKEDGEGCQQRIW